MVNEALALAHAGTTQWPPSPKSSGWNTFDRSLFYCLVISSETEAANNPRGLQAAFKQLLASKLEGIWPTIRTSINEGATVDGHRSLPADFDPGSIRRCLLRVTDALATELTFHDTVRMLVEADLAIFDVTRFEPAVMLLLGVRAATRRGVTIVSHGDKWTEGQPLKRPFNLADLSIASHTPTGATGAERISRLAERIETGFTQLRLQPHYHDLPVYDALRRLGAEPSAWSPIPMEKEILVLCSYSPAFQPTWETILTELSDALTGLKRSVEKIGRLQDFTTPQIVSQTLYEKIRRCVGCVVDWTEASPSTFFELGVRLVTSSWGTAQIAARYWIDRVEGIATSTGPDAEPEQAGEERHPETPPDQVRSMERLFKPVIYGSKLDVELGRTARELVAISGSGGQSGHRIRRIASDALQRVEPRVAEVTSALQAEADHLDDPSRQQVNVPQVLFSEGHAIKEDVEHAALERRLAAWFYLHHRLGAHKRSEDDPVRKQWRKLGIQIADDLLKDPEAADNFEVSVEIKRWVTGR